MNGITWAKSAVAGVMLIGSLAACGTSSTAPTPNAAGKINLNYSQTENMVESLMPTALANAGETPQVFCLAMTILPDSTLTADFMGGFNSTANGNTIDPAAVAPAVRAWCATNGGTAI